MLYTEMDNVNLISAVWSHCSCFCPCLHLLCFMNDRLCLCYKTSISNNNEPKIKSDQGFDLILPKSLGSASNAAVSIVLWYNAMISWCYQDIRWYIISGCTMIDYDTSHIVLIQNNPDSTRTISWYSEKILILPGSGSARIYVWHKQSLSSCCIADPTVGDYPFFWHSQGLSFSNVINV